MSRIRTLLGLHRVLLLAALVVALVGTGFGHRLSASADQALVFALANGVALDDICGDQPGTDGHGAQDCLACQIVGGADLPLPTALPVDLDLALAAGLAVPRVGLGPARVIDPAHRPQGPPVA